MFIRKQEINPALYYPKGYYPHIIQKWPVDEDLVIPFDDLPASMKKSMGTAWRHRQKNLKILEAQEKAKAQKK